MTWSSILIREVSFKRGSTVIVLLTSRESKVSHTHVLQSTIRAPPYLPLPPNNFGFLDLWKGALYGTCTTTPLDHVFT